MSPINITNLLVKIVAHNNMVNRNSNKNVNSQTSLLQNNTQTQQNSGRSNIALAQSAAQTQNSNAAQNLNQTQNSLLQQQSNIAQRNIAQNNSVVQNQASTAQSQNVLTQQQNVLAQNNIQNSGLVQQQNVVNNRQANLSAQNAVNNRQANVQQNNLAQNIAQQQSLVQNNVAQQNIQSQRNIQQNIIQQNNVLFGQDVNKTNNQANSAGVFGASTKNTGRLTQLAQTNTSALSNINVRNQNINYVKDMMKLPQEMKDVLSLVQQTQTAQAKASVQGETSLLTLSNINLKSLTLLIQNGSKEALKQIMNAAIAQNISKSDLKQLEEAISYLNASSSSQESQTQALKNFMLLYLPWLPLEEGMDFELDFTFAEGSEEDDENILNIVIMTKHFGEIHILIILKAMNNFEIYIQCCKKFPKRKLMKLIGEDENKYTLKTNMVFEEQKNYEPKTKAQEAKITLSHVKEISPFLLLIANSLIKNTLLLDAQLEKD